ncbi:MAG: DMT family transporter [Candidatus Shapirobacteria bacterium]|jgi:drug/metabolite transporter (DMT)-like permease
MTNKNGLIRKLFSPTAQLLLATVIWGSSFFIVKQATALISPPFLVAYRFLLAALLMGVVVWLLKKDFKGSIKAGIILGFVYAFAYLSQTIGIQSISSSNSSFITGLFVITTPIFSLLIFRKVPSRKFLLALTMAMIGLWALTGGVDQMKRGDFITLLVPLFIGLYNVLAEKFLRGKHDPLVLCFHQMWVMGLVCFIIGIMSGAPMWPKSNLVWLPILYLAIFPASISLFLQLNAQRSVSANQVGIITSLEPVFASLFAWWLANESMTMNTVIGGSLILGATLVSELKIRK